MLQDKIHTLRHLLYDVTNPTLKKGQSNRRFVRVNTQWKVRYQVMEEPDSPLITQIKGER